MSDAYELYQLGKRHLRSGMAAQATVALEKARRLEPEKASIREALGIAYFRIARWDAAEVEFRKLVELSPVDGYAHWALARTLTRLGRDEEAAPFFALARCFGRPEDNADAAA
jgi:Flp pilus assembly protein TadD